MTRVVRLDRGDNPEKPQDEDFEAFMMSRGYGTEKYIQNPRGLGIPASVMRDGTPMHLRVTIFLQAYLIVNIIVPLR